MRKILPPAIIALFLLVFLMANVFASQSFDSLLFRVVRGQNIADAKEFLGQIEKTEYYDEQFEYLNKRYNNALTQEIEENEFSRQQEIESYVALLKKNPQSRDVLVKLALLHFDVKNYSEAQRYYAEAKRVDPWIEVEVLEEL